MNITQQTCSGVRASRSRALLLRRRAIRNSAAARGAAPRASVGPTNSHRDCQGGGDEAQEEVSPLRRFAAGAAAVAAALSLSASPGWALDSAKVGKCLFSSCQLELARCIADEKCAENLICLNKCNGTKDEAGCQIRCGDLYADAAVKAFNTCAVTTKNCVPQRATPGAYPLPPADAVVPELDVKDLDGRWYISAGLNKLFDTFPCQVHYFTSPEPGRFLVKVNWRVVRPNGQFYERSDLQRFVQSPEQAGYLYNHPVGEEPGRPLHYKDDWYVIAFKKDSYALVYYRGSNDAWDGYGGAVLYTRESTFSEADVPEFSAAAARVGLRWSDFERTDNTCGPEPPLTLARVTDLDVLVDDARALEEDVVRDVVAVERAVEKAEAGIEGALVSFGRNFTLYSPAGGSSAGGKPAAKMNMEKSEAAALKRLEAMESKMKAAEAAKQRKAKAAEMAQQRKEEKERAVAAKKAAEAAKKAAKAAAAADGKQASALRN